MQKSGKHRIFQFLTTSNNPLIYNPLQRFGCHQSVKDKNFESNSQLLKLVELPSGCLPFRFEGRHLILQFLEFCRT